MEGDNMANPEHLAILQKGVVAWNEWWNENRPLPDLSGACLGGVNLSGAILTQANFREADLRGTNLGGAHLIHAQFRDANLDGANFGEAELRNAFLDKVSLVRANLFKADLRYADLRDADLTGADLRWAKLNEADLSEATLTGAKLRGAKLNGANLSGASLDKADLRGAKLREVNLGKADLREANLRWAELDKADLTATNLREANLRRSSLAKANLTIANLRGANFQNVDARWSQLCRCNFTKANLTGTKLYATARDDWIIEDVECRYVFWDAKGKIRSPKDRDLAPGEFERLYRTLPTIEYVFRNGMTPLDPLIMDRVVQAIREQNPEYDIKIDSISARGLAPSIKFTIQQEEHKEPALQMIVEGYESRVQRLEAEKDRLYDLLGRAIDKAGTRLIEAGPGAVVAMDNASINIEQHIHHAVELQKAVAEQPENSETFRPVAKRKVMDVIGGAIQDFAKGKVREAAAEIVSVCKDLGPVIVNTAAYGFFKSCLGL